MVPPEDLQAPVPAPTIPGTRCKRKRKENDADAIRAFDRIQAARLSSQSHGAVTDFPEASAQDKFPPMRPIIAEPPTAENLSSCFDSTGESQM